NARTASSRTLLNTYELLAYIRRPRRSQGLGTHLLESVCDEARKQLPWNVLRVRYPKSGRGGGTDQDLEMWKGFFALYNFRPVVGPAGRRESVMELTL